MSEKRVEISFSGPDARLPVIARLESTLNSKGIQTERLEGQLHPGQMGFDLLPILSVALGSKVLVEVAKALQLWITSSRPRVKLRIESEGGRVVEIDSENVLSEKWQLEEILSQLKE